MSDLGIRLAHAMARRREPDDGLLTDVPWHFVSGRHDPSKVTPVTVESRSDRLTAAILRNREAQA